MSVLSAPLGVFFCLCPTSKTAYSCRFSSNIASSVSFSLLALKNYFPCLLLAVTYFICSSLLSIGYHILRCLIFYSAVTVSSGGKWALWRQDWCLIHLEPSAPKTGLTKSKCIKLVQAPKRALEDRAGVWVSFIVELDSESFLGFSLTMLFWGSYLLLKLGFII